MNRFWNVLNKQRTMFLLSRTPTAAEHLTAFTGLTSTSPPLSFPVQLMSSSDVSLISAEANANPKASDYHFDLKKFYSILKTEDNGPGSLVAYIHQLPSTQDFLKQHTFLPNGTLCVCDLQIKGRGRGENIWTSPPGCLTFTLKSVLPIKYGNKLPFIQYIASLAIIRAINSCMKNQIKAKIKWPNDIYLSEIEGYPEKKVKIGGILCESVTKGNSFELLIGIGLNVDNSEPTVCLNDFLDSKIEREILLAKILNQIELLIQILLSEQGNGFADVKEEYLQSWLHSGQVVTLQTENKVVKVTSISDVTGALVAEDENSRKYELYPDGNRLDFFRGLISRKI